ncbi:expansin EXLX1 family cellulose-binding protein [Streptomyces sp. NRRL S-481]|uniref:expansin EXLX1 family cellulose-binding protein n=1 Tax=Streptomyces sp. NRRL S-481 TaxID=1463911 RepID=UPI0004C7CB57|nr:expansin EXLX1 family cellulose-binding protein [Streptomyces sp. NRRL S-481]
MASRSHRRPLRRRRSALVPAVALAAVALLVSLVVALRPGGEPDTVRAAAAPSTTPRASVTLAAPKAKATPKPKPKKPSTKTPAPARTTTPAPVRPSPAGSPRSSPRAVSDSAPLAGRIKPQVSYKGVATHYDAADGDGACLYGPSPDLMVAAMNTTDYETSKACGAHILVRTAGGASVTVRVTNECPLPCAPGQLDLSKEAFAKLADLSSGRISITWSLLSPSIQALGHRNPLARLEVSTGNGWSRLTRTEYNYFLSPDGNGCGGPLRLTDIYGEQLTVDGIAVRPDAVQPTRVQFARH